MADGFAELDEIIARVRSMGTLARDVAPDVAERCKEQLDAQIARGEGPDGKPWPSRKADGTRPLEHADKAVGVAAVGATVIMTVRGPEALHSKGTARGGVQRQIIPSREIPGPLVRAISEVVTERFHDVAKGGR